VPVPVSGEYAPAGYYGASRATGSICQLTGTHMPHGITQCYLPPGRGDIPALTPVEAGIRLSDPGGMQGCFDLVSLLHTEIPTLPQPKTVTHRSTVFCLKINSIVKALCPGVTGEDLPTCQFCSLPLTVNHILLECAKLQRWPKV